MKDLILAIGIVLVSALMIAMLPLVFIIIGSLISFALIVWAVWIFLQIIKDDDPSDPG